MGGKAEAIHCVHLCKLKAGLINNWRNPLQGLLCGINNILSVYEDVDSFAVGNNCYFCQKGCIITTQLI